jgi:hypothetical protein
MKGFNNSRNASEISPPPHFQMGGRHFKKQTKKIEEGIKIPETRLTNCMLLHTRL